QPPDRILRGPVSRRDAFPVGYGGQVGGAGADRAPAARPTRPLEHISISLYVWRPILGVHGHAEFAPCPVPPSISPRKAFPRDTPTRSRTASRTPSSTCSCPRTPRRAWPARP